MDATTKQLGEVLLYGDYIFHQATTATGTFQALKECEPFEKLVGQFKTVSDRISEKDQALLKAVHQLIESPVDLTRPHLKNLYNLWKESRHSLENLILEQENLEHKVEPFNTFQQNELSDTSSASSVASENDSDNPRNSSNLSFWSNYDNSNELTDTRSVSSVSSGNNPDIHQNLNHLSHWSDDSDSSEDEQDEYDTRRDSGISLGFSNN